MSQGKDKDQKVDDAVKRIGEQVERIKRGETSPPPKDADS